MTIRGSTITENNVDGYGGGILIETGSLVITNRTFSKNTTPNIGGGIYMFPGSTLMVTNSIFTENSADQLGGAIANEGSVRMTNSTLSGNYAESGAGTIFTGRNDLFLYNSIMVNSTMSDGSSGLDCYNTNKTGIPPVTA